MTGSPRAALGTAVVLCLTLSSCAWFRTPPSLSPNRPQVSADSLQVQGLPDSAAVADSAGAVSTPGSDSSMTAEAPPSPAVVDTAREGAEPWIFEGGTLKATSTPAGLLHEATLPRVRHGRLTLSADGGTYLHDSAVGTLVGGVKVQEDSLRGESDRAVYYRAERKLVAEGHVQVWKDSLYATGPRLEYDRNTDIALMLGGVRGRDGGRTFASRNMEWDQGRELLVLSGEARVEEPDGSVVGGDTILYDLVTKQATVEGRPQLSLSSQSGVQTRLRAENLRLEGDNAYAKGSVTVYRGRVTARGDSAAYFGAERRAVLLGSPKVHEPNGTLWADTLHLVFDEDDALETVEGIGGAGLRYAPADTARLGEVSEVEADGMVITFVDGGIDHLTATPNARSFYRAAPADKDGVQGENTATGDTIIVQMAEEDSGVEWVRILGRAQGTYVFRDRAGPPPPDSASVRALPDTAAVADTAGVFDPTAGSLFASGDTTTAGSPMAADSTVTVEKVVYEAHEVLFRFEDRIVELTGDAQADYDPMTLNADRVRFHLRSRYLEAEGNPTLRDRSQRGQDPIVGTRMDYNLDSKEGRVRAGRTQAESGYVYADELRQVGDGDFLARGGSMTSCSLAEDGGDPHFHFGSDRMRIYLNDKVVAKPITLYIRNMPVFRLPFYVFPIRKGRQSGFLTPQFGFGQGGEDSRFIKNLGYYWATNDYMDLEVSTDWYDQDNKVVPAVAYRYKWLKYDLSGNASIRHLRSTRQSLWDLSAGHSMTWNDWRVTATGEYRDQEFRGEEAVTGNIGQAVDRILKNSLDLSRRLDFGSLRLSFKSTRDLAVDAEDGSNDNVVTETLPEYSLTVNSRPLGREAEEDGEGGFLPFLSNTSWSFSSTGSRRHFEDEVTRIDSTDTGLDTLVVREDTDQTRATHRLNLSDRRKLFGVLSVGPSLSLTEHWVDREFSAADTSMGFHRASTWSASMDANTQLFGTLPGPGPVESFRHVLKPRASLQYSPNTDGLLYTGEDGVRRNRFPGVSGFERRVLALSLGQDFMAKVKSGEGVKRVDLMSWNLGASYDFLDDDEPFSDVSSTVSLRRILGVTVNFNSTHDTYRQFRFQRYTLDGAFGFQGALPGAQREEEGPREGLGPGAGPGRNTSLEELGGDVYDPDRKEASPSGERALTYRANFSYSVAGSRGLDDSFESRSTLRSSFQVQLTQNWAFNYSNLWRISDGEVTGERFSVSRDLHCWEAHLEGNRVGDNLSFYFRINIKDLQDIKVEQGRQGAEIGGLSRILP